LFLGSVGPLWLRDLGKFMRDSSEVIWGHRPSSWEEFLSAPIHSPPLWSPNRSFRIVCMRQAIGPMMNGVELAKASNWLRYSRRIVCMRQATDPVMTGVELAKASSWLRYSQIIVCMRQATGPVMTGVELAKASSWLHYSQSIVCGKQTTGPVMTEVQLAKASIWLRYNRGSVCRKQTTGRVTTGVELRHTEGPRVASERRHRRPESGFGSETPRRTDSAFGFVCAMQIEMDCSLSNKLLSFLNKNDSPWM
jgi:hypothetical protein